MALLSFVLLGWILGSSVQPLPPGSGGGRITEFEVPTSDSLPAGIAAGPDGAVWFAEFHGNKIGRIDASGRITEFPIPTPDSGPTLLCSGPDGAIWFTEFNADRIGRLAPGGGVTEFPIPTPG